MTKDAKSLQNRDTKSDCSAIAAESPRMTRVVIESPYKPLEHRARNLCYLRSLALFALDEGLAPYASHGLLTHWLDDEDERERDLGIRVGLTWALSAELVIVGVDYGVSSGMERALEVHRSRRAYVALPIWFVKLGPEWGLNWCRGSSKLPAWQLPGFEVRAEWQAGHQEEPLRFPRGLP